MNSGRTYITPRKVSLLGLRLVVLFLFFGSLSSIGYIIYALVNRDSRETYIIGPQAAILLVYISILLLLLQYPEAIARIISKRLPRFSVQSRWTRVELLSVILAGVAAFEILSEVPVLLNQVHAILSRYQDMVISGAPEKERMNFFVVGLLATFINIGVATFVFVKAGRLAVTWEKWQSSGGFKNTLSRRQSTKRAT